MIYYIDFDSTLFNTSGFIKEILIALSKEINFQDCNLGAEKIYLEVKKVYAKDNIYNLNELCKYFAEKYNLNEERLVNSVDNVINNGKDFVYNDSVEFLKNLINNGHKINLLTYTLKERIEYQVQKVYGSGLVKYFENIIITTAPKWKLDLNYSNGIFIDDNPKDLAGLYHQNSQAVVRIKREGNKYSSKSMPDNIEIPEYASLKEFCQRDQIWHNDK